MNSISHRDLSIIEEWVQNRFSEFDKRFERLERQFENDVKTETLEETPKIQLSSDGKVVTAEWFPTRPGMPIVGRGRTVLEAVGELVIYDQIVELIPSHLVNTCWSVADRSCARR